MTDDLDKVSSRLGSLGARTEGVGASPELLHALRELPHAGGGRGTVWAGVLRLAAPSLVLASVTLAVVFGVGKALEPSPEDDFASLALEELP